MLVFKRMASLERKNNTVSYIPLILFVCNVLVLTNTNRDYFRQMGKLDYYTFNQYSIWCSIGLFIETMILGWYGWLSIIRNRDGLETKIKRVYGLCLVGMLICLIIIYSVLAPIWSDDPTHSLPFYNNFWSDSVMDIKMVTNSTQLSPLRGGNSNHDIYNKQWAYILADIIVRFWGIIMMAIPIVLLITIICMVTLWWVGYAS
jgi:hypothetical protein